MSQCNRLLAYMRENGPITSNQALHSLGIARLAARIGELREQGHSIATVAKTVLNRFGEPCRVAEYHLEEGK